MYAEVSDARRFAQSEWNQLRRCKARTQRPRSELVQLEIAGVMGMRIKVPPSESPAYTPRRKRRPVTRGVAFYIAADADCCAERLFDALGASSRPARRAANGSERAPLGYRDRPSQSYSVLCPRLSRRMYTHLCNSDGWEFASAIGQEAESRDAGTQTLKPNRI